MSLYHKLEAKYARWSIPSLIKLLAIFQVVVWVMVKIQPEFLEFLLLNRDLVFQGQVWRMLTWIFYVGDIHWLFVVFYVMFVFAISDTLDTAWGQFKVNLFIFGGMLAVVAHELLLGGLIKSSDPSAMFPYGMWFNSSIIMAFASVAPRFQVMLFFVIPVQMKWLGIVSGALLFITAVSNPILFPPVLACCVNFLVAWLPSYLRERRGLAQARPNTAAFRQSAETTNLEAFHLCHACGKTELDDKSLSFRVAADGEEYCSGCRSTNKSN